MVPRDTTVVVGINPQSRSNSSCNHHFSSPKSPRRTKRRVRHNRKMAKAKKHVRLWSYLKSVCVREREGGRGEFQLVC